jgi:hypothetical protein
LCSLKIYFYVGFSSHVFLFFFPSLLFFVFRVRVSSSVCSEAKKLSSPLPHASLVSLLSSRREPHTRTRERAFCFPKTTLFFRHETTRHFFSYTKSLPEHKPADIYKNTMAFAALSTVRVVASVSRRRFFSLGFFVLSLSLSRARTREPPTELITDTCSIHFE